MKKVLGSLLFVLLVAAVPLKAPAWPTLCQGAIQAYSNAVMWHNLCKMYSEPGAPCAETAANVQQAQGWVDLYCNFSQE